MGPRSYERGRSAGARSSIPAAGLEERERFSHFLAATYQGKTSQVVSLSISTRERSQSDVSSPRRSHAFEMSKNLCPIVLTRRSMAHQAACRADPMPQSPGRPFPPRDRATRKVSDLRPISSPLLTSFREDTAKPLLVGDVVADEESGSHRKGKCLADCLTEAGHSFGTIHV